MKNLYLLFISLFVLLISCSNQENTTSQDKSLCPPPAITGTPLLWGFDNAGDESSLKTLGNIIKEFGFDLAIHHYSPNISTLKQLGDFYAEQNVKLILNLESANNDGSSFIDANGFDWYNHNDGTHYFMFPTSALEILSKLPSGTGVMYDEPEHMQNRYGMDVPYFMRPEDVNKIEEASSVFTEKIRKIADTYKKYNIEIYAEHVFPIQFHNFANAGFTPVPKMLKESCMPAYIAIALGASMQYNTPLWFTPDLWYKNNYPGHSAEQYKSALLMSYHMGADAIYTENINYKGSNEGVGKGSLVLMKNNNTSYSITELGEVNKWFRWEYAPANPRNYKHQDLKPKVAIIRQEDACWGQRNSWLPDRLFGVDEWKSNETNEAWLEIWNLLSNGQISKASINWNNNEVGNIPYYVFAPLDGVVVFDEKVQAECLKDVELIFLTGIGISESTLQAVEDKVANGAVCVSLPHLVPQRIKDIVGKSEAFKTINDNKGKWVITNTFISPDVKTQVESYLPKKNYMRYRFGNTYVEIYPINSNSNKIEVSLKQID